MWTKGAWHVYGHVHGNKGSGNRADAINFMRGKERALNAGCMLNGFAPASFEEMIINNKKFWDNGA